MILARPARVLLSAALGLLAAVGPAIAADTLRIGVEAPLSGPDAIFGNQIRLGVEQAVADINAGGGFLGRKARVVTGDDGSDPKRGMQVAEGFAKSSTNLVVGPFSSAVAVPVSAAYAEANIFDITPSAIAPLVTERGLPTVFRTGGREDQQAAIAARFFAARRYTRVAVLHDRSGPGKALADATRKALAAAGITDVFYGSVADDKRDMAGLVGRLRAADSQAVFWAGGASGDAQLARKLSDVGYHPALLGGLATASDDFASIAGSAADGAMVIFPQDPRDRPAAADLLRRLKARGQDPGAYVFYAYAAVEVIRAAADAAQSLDPTALAEALHRGATTQTVIGPLAFDAKGDPTTSDLTVYVWHKGPSGRMVFLDPAQS